MASAAAKCGVRVVLLTFIACFVYLCYVVVHQNSPSHDIVDFHNEKITSVPSLPVKIDKQPLPAKPSDDLSKTEEKLSHTGVALEASVVNSTNATHSVSAEKEPKPTSESSKNATATSRFRRHK
jgi:hypothetical protein